MFIFFLLYPFAHPRVLFFLLLFARPFLAPLFDRMFLSRLCLFLTNSWIRIQMYRILHFLTYSTCHEGASQPCIKNLIIRKSSHFFQASPTESQELDFLTLICDKILKSPHLVQVELGIMFFFILTFKVFFHTYKRLQ